VAGSRNSPNQVIVKDPADGRKGPLYADLPGGHSEATRHLLQLFRRLPIAGHRSAPVEYPQLVDGLCGLQVMEKG
jgi:hypothetical protein